MLEFILKIQGFSVVFNILGSDQIKENLMKLIWGRFIPFLIPLSVSLDCFSSSFRILGPVTT